MTDYFPYTAKNIIDENPEFIQAIWNGVESSLGGQAIFNNSTTQAYAIEGVSSHDYLVINSDNNTFIVSSLKEEKFSHELNLLKNGYDKSVYFNLSIASFYNKTLTKEDSFNYLSKKGDFDKIYSGRFQIFQGELIAINIELSILSDFVKSLQKNNLFPAGDIDKELIHFGEIVGLKNNTQEFIPLLENSLSILSQYNIQEKDPIFFHDTKKLFLGTIENTFVIKDEKIGYIAQYISDNNSWFLYDFGKHSKHKTAEDVFISISKKQIEFVPHVMFKSIGNTFDYFGAHLLNTHLDLVATSETLDSFKTEQNNNKLKLK